METEVVPRSHQGKRIFNKECRQTTTQKVTLYIEQVVVELLSDLLYCSMASKYTFDCRYNRLRSFTFINTAVCVSVLEHIQFLSFTNKNE
jgi:hypothetical protein